MSVMVKRIALALPIIRISVSLESWLRAKQRLTLVEVWSTMLHVLVRDLREKHIAVADKECCCQYHKELAKLADSGSNDALLEELIEQCASLGDEYAKYLKASISAEDEDSSDSSARFIERMESLASELNPWALAELGLFYTFDQQNRKLGTHYLFLAALFGEMRAQFYYGYSLLDDPKSQLLAARLINAAADQGYERAIDHINRPSGR